MVVQHPDAALIQPLVDLRIVKQPRPLPWMDRHCARRGETCGDVAAGAGDQCGIDPQPMRADHRAELGRIGRIVGVREPDAGLEAGVIGVAFGQCGLQRQAA